jgi:hypothetical protein
MPTTSARSRGEGELVLGPEAGVAEPANRVSVPVSYQNIVVGELAVDGQVEAEWLERVATLISTHVLLGWDTGGEVREQWTLYPLQWPPCSPDGHCSG